MNSLAAGQGPEDRNAKASQDASATTPSGDTPRHVLSYSSDKGQNPSRRSAIRVGTSIVVLLLLLGLLGWYWLFKNRNSSRIRTLPAIVEEQEVRLSSKVGGRVLEILTSEGSHATQGDVLVRLDGRELQAKRRQLESQLTIVEAKHRQAVNGALPEQIEAAKALLDQSKARYEALQTGSRPEEIEAARAEVAVRISEESRAQAEFDRIRELFEKNAVSRSDFDQSQSALRQARGWLDAAKQKLQMWEIGPRKEAIAEALAEVKKREADVALLVRGTREEEIDQLKGQIAEVNARIAEVNVNLEECEVKAPENCTIEVISLRVGDLAAPNQPIIRIRYPEDIWVKAYIPETELSRIRVGQDVEVTHDGSKKVFVGTIVHIASVGEFTPRNVQSVSERKHLVFAIKIRVQDPEGAFKSGMAAEVRLVPKPSEAPPNLKGDL